MSSLQDRLTSRRRAWRRTGGLAVSSRRYSPWRPTTNSSCQAGRTATLVSATRAASSVASLTWAGVRPAAPLSPVTSSDRFTYDSSTGIQSWNTHTKPEEWATRRSVMLVTIVYVHVFGRIRCALMRWNAHNSRLTRYLSISVGMVIFDLRHWSPGPVTRRELTSHMVLAMNDSFSWGQRFRRYEERPPRQE